MIDFLSNLIGHPGHRAHRLTCCLWPTDIRCSYAACRCLPRLVALAATFRSICGVARLGYDGRALAVWTLVAWALVLISFFFHAATGIVPIRGG